MNFVTPRQRQQWLSQAEDYADIVRSNHFFPRRCFPSLSFTSFSKRPSTFSHTLPACVSSRRLSKMAFECGCNGANSAITSWEVGMSDRSSAHFSWSSISWVNSCLVEWSWPGKRPTLPVEFSCLSLLSKSVHRIRLTRHDSIFVFSRLPIESSGNLVSCWGKAGLVDDVR